MSWCSMNIFKYQNMNTAEKDIFAGDILQVHLAHTVEPWFIRRELESAVKGVTGNNAPTISSTFIDYYY